MIITLARVDDRLIHGQVTTVWSKESNEDRIIIVSSEVYKDDIRKTLLKQAAPPGMKVNIVDVPKAIAVYNNPKYSKDKVFYLFTNPSEVVDRDCHLTIDCPHHTRVHHHPEDSVVNWLTIFSEYLMHE